MAAENEKTPVLQIVSTTKLNESLSFVCSSESLFEMDAKLENEKNIHLDKKWREKAANELNESDEIKETCIKQLRQMLITSANKTISKPHTVNSNFIPNGRKDDAFLLRFLRAKKFDVEKAYKMIIKYYSMKKQSPELFKVSPASQLHDLLKMQIQYMVPDRDPNGRKLYIFRVKKCDPYKCHVETVFRTNVLALENAVREPETQIGGLIVLLDMAGAGLGHAKFLAPYLARKTVEVVQEAFPLRFKAFHILHEPFYFDAILAVLKPFLKEKIRHRIHLHGSNLSSLHKYISLDILPAEYGGTQSNFDNTQWRSSLMNDESYFQRLETFDFINNSLEDSGIEIENDTEEINGNHLGVEQNSCSINNNGDDQNPTKTLLDSIIATNSISSTKTKGETSTGIPFTNSDNDDDESDEYELCEDYLPSDVKEQKRQINKKISINGNLTNDSI